MVWSCVRKEVVLYCIRADCLTQVVVCVTPYVQPSLRFICIYVAYCRIRSFLRPDNAGITAAEALTAPFFTYDQDRGFFLDT